MERATIGVNYYSIFLTEWIKHNLSLLSVAEFGEALIAHIIAYPMIRDNLGIILLVPFKDTVADKQKFTDILGYILNSNKLPYYRDVLFPAFVNYLVTTHQFSRLLNEVEVYEAVNGESKVSLEAKIMALSTMDFALHGEKLKELVERSLAWK